MGQITGVDSSNAARAGAAAYGSAPTQKGERAGESFKSQDDVDTEKWTQEFDKLFGATGIAGAGKRAKPEYKSGLSAHIAKRKAERDAAKKAEPIIKTGM